MVYYVFVLKKKYYFVTLEFTRVSNKNQGCEIKFEKKIIS